MTGTISHPILGPIFTQALTNRLAPTTTVQRVEYVNGQPQDAFGMPDEDGEDMMGYMAGMGDYDVDDVDVSPHTIGLGAPEYGSNRAARGLATSLSAIAQALQNAINKTNKQVRRNSSNIADLRRRFFRGASRINQKRKNERWLDSALAIGQSIPGVKAYGALTSTKRRELLASLYDVVTSYVEDKATKPAAFALTNIPAVSGSDASVTTAFNQVQANQDVVTARIEALEALVHDLLDAVAKEKVGDSLKQVVAESEPDAIGQLASLLPAQLGDSEMALFEAIGKNILGRPAGTSGGLLNVSL